MPVAPGRAGVRTEMEKFKAGKLHSGSKTGRIVTNPRQAIAISLHEAGLSNRGGQPTKPTTKTPGKLQFTPKLKKPGPGGLY